jgi:hypothetical protein
MPPEVTTFVAATLGDRPIDGATASQAEFPDLTAPARLALTVDELGWYRLTVVDAVTGDAATGYVRRTWARDRTLDLLGINRSGFDLRRP